MSFIIFDLVFLFLFTLGVVIFLYIERKKLDREGWLYLYRTKIGLKILDYLGKKHKRTLKFMSYIVVFSGYVLMILSVYFILKLLYFFTNPAFVQAVKVPPIMPLIPYLPELFNVTWLPPFYFTYWILAIATIAIFHEGAHGIFARFYNIRIKSTGIGFLGPFLAFFVEQDEKQMQKSSPFKQMTLLGAGVFANVLIGIIFFLFLVAYANSAYTASGVVFQDYSYSVMNASVLGSSILLNQTIQVDGRNLTKIGFNNKAYYILPEFLKLDYNGKDKSRLLPFYQESPALTNSIKGAIIEVNSNKISSLAQLKNAMEGFKPGDNISITAEYKENKTLYAQVYKITLSSDYSNDSRAVLGIATLNPRAQGFKGFAQSIVSFFKDPAVYYKAKMNPDAAKFIYDLLWWMFLINMSVAIANMIPLGIFDGGRFFYLTVLLVTKKEKVAAWSFKWLTRLLLALIALMMVFWVIGMF